MKHDAYRFDPVTYAGYELVLFPHAVDKLHGDHIGVIGLPGSSVQCSSESIPNGEQIRGQQGDKVLTGTRGNDGVVCTREGRTVVSCHHQTHL